MRVITRPGTGLGQTEVDHLESGDFAACPAQEQIVWLDVAVVDVLLVCRGQARGGFPDQIERGARWHGAGSLQVLPHRFAAQQLHDKIRHRCIF
jgi:hypothetical protein